ncbi:MAG: hypothetical protein LBJ59_06790 [Zoogloeaceae bacterium]|jgi:hypothetical protein|nr:hypothetical protein [Zoogloeaceae bacterium]
MEATGIYQETVAEFMAHAGYRVSVDAGLIARFCHERVPEPWQAPSPDAQIPRAILTCQAGANC